MKLSYQIVDSFVWLGIRDMINDLRKRKLKLRPVTYLSGTHAYSNDIPHAYIWSPYLVPKPKDWGPKIDVVGFCFLDLASDYEPPETLLRWLGSGDSPIYIGFGSLVSFYLLFRTNLMCLLFFLHVSHDYALKCFIYTWLNAVFILCILCWSVHSLFSIMWNKWKIELVGLL
ncbi:Sterol 3-beta-glucosyltransferase UGT80A2 [Zea mays]|uniref:Sterol 3-beta-glucosyltransferase UGT80A2 n=1 Tax=Zea mays TaxID=4577 RepID=A0A1D6EKX3_MAIZE|nr:Sterol 3-beta-glucosyltransferase UGT80A2 [Zea mays]